MNQSKFKTNKNPAMSTGVPMPTQDIQSSSPPNISDDMRMPHIVVLEDKQKTQPLSPETWLQIYNPSTFNQLHLQIYNIIRRITQQQQYHNHYFTQEWTKL